MKKKGQRTGGELRTEIAVLRVTTFFIKKKGEKVRKSRTGKRPFFRGVRGE